MLSFVKTLTGWLTIFFGLRLAGGGSNTFLSAERSHKLGETTARLQSSQ